MKIEEFGIKNEVAYQKKPQTEAHTIEGEGIASHAISEENKSLMSLAEDKKQFLVDAIESASGKIEVENKELEFSIHEETNQIMIKVINQDTKEIVKEIPSKKILDMIGKMMELAGSFIDERR